jgi:hypothetical protein
MLLAQQHATPCRADSLQKATNTVLFYLAASAAEHRQQQHLTSCTYSRAISLLSGLSGPAALTHRAALTCRQQPAGKYCSVKLDWT